MDCLKIAKQASYSFYQKNFHLEPDEVLAEAYSAMMEALRTFNPTKGRNLNSWVGFKVNRRLRKKFQVKEELPDDLSKIISSTYSQTNPESILLFKETINSFSDAAKETVSMLLNSQIEATGKNKTKREIKEKLRTKGFSYNKIQKAFHELRSFANSLA